MDNNNVDTTFIARRRAQIYVEILKKEGDLKAGQWILQNVPDDGSREEMQPYVKKLLFRRR